MNAHELDIQIAKYEAAFIGFTKEFEFPPEWFKVPDHFAIKCADGADYDETVGMVQSTCNPIGVWEIEMGERRLLSAHIRFGAAISESEFNWVEVMEPRPGSQAGLSFVEHTEFVFPDFYAITRALDIKGVMYTERKDNPGHQTVEVVIDDDGREIKFNNKPLAAVVAEESEQSLITTIIEPPQEAIADVVDLKPRDKA